MAATLEMIPFDEMVEGATVRFTVIDNQQYMSVRDIILVVCDKTVDTAGRVWREMSDEHKDDLRQYLSTYKFTGRGQLQQPVISFPGALKLMMFLPGSNAKKNRGAMVKILHRFYAGDKSLLTEIEANAMSDSPVAQMARASLPAADDNKAALTRKRQLLEIEDLELNNLEKRARIESMTIANKTAAEMHIHAERQAAIAAVLSFQTLMCSLSADVSLDGRTRLALEDIAKNDFMAKRNTKLITNAEGDEKTKNEGGWGTISISEVAKDLGIKAPLSSKLLQSIGLSMSKLYRNKYDQVPEKHSSFVNGTERMINSYTKRDLEMMQQAIGMHVEIDDE